MSRDNRTYPQNFIRDLLGLSLPLLKVWTTPIELGGIDLFVERSLYAEQFFVCRELIPAAIGGTRAERYIINVCPKSYGGRRIGSVGSPGGQLSFLSKTGFVTNIGVGLEG